MRLIYEFKQDFVDCQSIRRLTGGRGHSSPCMLLVRDISSFCHRDRRFETIRMSRVGLKEIQRSIISKLFKCLVLGWKKCVISRKTSVEIRILTPSSYFYRFSRISKISEKSEEVNFVSAKKFSASIFYSWEFDGLLESRLQTYLACAKSPILFRCQFSIGWGRPPIGCIFEVKNEPSREGSSDTMKRSFYHRKNEAFFGLYDFLLVFVKSITLAWFECLTLIDLEYVRL